MLLLKLFLLNYLIIRNNLLISINSDHRSVIPATAAIPEKPAFFISAAGWPMNESMISKRIDAIGKWLNPSMPGNLLGSRLRKGIVTMQRSSESAPISPKKLAKQMSHSVSTAQKYYNIEDESDIRVHSFLSSLFKPKPKELVRDDPKLKFVSDDNVQTVAENILPPKESNPPLPPLKEYIPPQKECMPPPKECIPPPTPIPAAPVHQRADPREKRLIHRHQGSSRLLLYAQSLLLKKSHPGSQLEKFCCHHHHLQLRLVPQDITGQSCKGKSSTMQPGTCHSIPAMSYTGQFKLTRHARNTR